MPVRNLIAALALIIGFQWFQSSVVEAQINPSAPLTGPNAFQSNPNQAASRKSAEEQFNRFDVTGNGFLTGPEIDSANARRFDSNQDNAVSLEEYVAGNLNAAAQSRVKNSSLESKKNTPNANRGTIKATQPVTSRMIQGKPEGLFFMQRYWIATRFIEKSCWYFAPDGQFYENLATGFSAEELAAHKGSKGRYSVSGGQMQVIWSDGKSSQSPIKEALGGFDWDTGMFAIVEPFQEGKSISGTYEDGTSLASGGGSITLSKSLRINEDGTFEMAGISSLTSTSDNTQANAGSRSGTTGRWQLEGYTMTLTTSDETQTHHIAFPLDDAKTPAYPDRLFIGGTAYQHR